MTGYPGFLSRPLVEQLRAHGRPRPFLAGLTAAPGSMVCDLRDPAAARRLVDRCRPDLVFHLAGTTLAQGFEALWTSHVAATLNLLEALRAASRPRRPCVVLAGSSAEYGELGRRSASEDMPPAPRDPYGASKLAQSLAALSFRHLGLRIAAARIFNVLGPGMPDNLVLGSFARQIAEAEAGLRPAVLQVGQLRRWRDFVDVRDVARALLRLGLADGVEGTYNVCTGRPACVLDLLRSLLRLSPLRFRVEVRRSRLRPGDVAYMRGNSRRIRDACGWKPRIPLATSLRDTLEWHRRRVGGRRG